MQANNCNPSTYGASSGSWVLCGDYGSEAWVSGSGGSYNAPVVCASLGFQSVIKQGGTCGTVCGRCDSGTCASPTTYDSSLSFDGGGGDASSMGNTVMWACGNPGCPYDTVKIELHTDNYPEETSWSISLNGAAGSHTWVSGEHGMNPTAAQTLYTWEMCMPLCGGSAATWYIWDSFPDGFQGWAKMWVNGVSRAEIGIFDGAGTSRTLDV